MHREIVKTNLGQPKITTALIALSLTAALIAAWGLLTWPREPASLPANAHLALLKPAASGPAIAPPSQPVVRRSQLEAPPWAIPYGKEFWRRTGADMAVDPKNPGAAKMPVAVNIRDIVERVRHALARDGTTAEPQVVAETYMAKFDGKGLVFSPHRPGRELAPGSAEEVPDLHAASTPDKLATVASEPHAESGRYRDLEAPRNVRLPQPDMETELLLRTVGVRQGNSAIYAAEAATPEWSYVGNTAQARLEDKMGLVEHYELRTDGAHLTWVLGQKPTGSGSVTIDVTAAGLSYAGHTQTGEHFADANGTARVCVGRATAVDATGKTWRLVVRTNVRSSGGESSRSSISSQSLIPNQASQNLLASAATSQFRIEIPSMVLAESTYPLAIDPIIGSEFGLDNPVLSPALEDQFNPSVAWNGTNWLVVWADARSGTSTNIYGARVDGGGVVLDNNGIAICRAANGQPDPKVAADGTDWLVVWQDDRNSGTSGADIYGARVNGGGVLLDTNGIAICTAASAQYAPSVAANGSDWLVVWEDSRNSGTSGWDIYGTRVNGSGVVLNSSGIAISTAANIQYLPSVAVNGTNWLVVWEDYRGGSSYDIYGARVNGSGVVLDSSGIAISTAASDQDWPSVAANGTNWLVVWEDHRSGSSYDVYGARVNAGGTVLDSGGIAISTAVNEQRYPTVAANATNWLVVWQDARSGGYYDLYGARVSGNGVVSESSGIAISTAARSQLYPSVAANGTEWLVVWQDYRNDDGSGVNTDIYGARVDANGALLDNSGIAISTVAGDQLHPAVAANGTEWLVVWQDYRNDNGIGTNADIYGVRLNESGMILDTGGIAISTEVRDQVYPSVAANGTQWLVVWQDYRNDSGSGLNADVYGARVDANGTVLDSGGIAITTAGRDQVYPSVAANGADWLVVWQDGRSGGSYDIYGARVNASGMVLDGGGIVISSAVNDQEFPSAAAKGTNWLVVWQDNRDSGTSGWDIYGARVGANGLVMDGTGITISAAANDQRYPAVAANGTNWLVVWQDLRSASVSTNDIYGARLDGSGTVLDSNGIAISTAANNQSHPCAAANGPDWVVAWEDRRSGGYAGIYGASVGGDGGVLDAAGFAINIGPGDHLNPAVAELAGQHLVVYSGPSGTGATGIRANIVSVPYLYITIQPANCTNDAGTDASFTVTVNGSAPLSYQWIQNETNYLTDGGKVSGATTRALTLSNVQDVDAGSYSIVVSNPAGSVTSSNATLTVIPRVMITSVTLLDGVTLVFGGTGGSGGAAYYVLASTNVAEWMTNWMCIATNTFEVDGSFSVTIAVDPTKETEFFRLQVP